MTSGFVRLISSAISLARAGKFVASTVSCSALAFACSVGRSGADASLMMSAPRYRLRDMTVRLRFEAPFAATAAGANARATSAAMATASARR